ncbi:putative chloride channel protein [Pedobacter sp. BAL39]|uniref:chloride channel protein n=1 Tax=Pedobacter sp. BAL39 TaxID=391596 RepID=UPI000155A01A|nr:chloride channel protein [Pedobacter sp. BAL39]EDM36811.1 putative chloride channel protein [Pedobacter sp. BAL39]
MYVRMVNYLDTINQYRRTKISNRNFLVIAAVIVGALAGLAASLLKAITHHIEAFLQDGFHWQYKYYLFFFFPFIGILLSVMYVRRFIRKDKFETGLTPVLYSISSRSSKIKFHNIYSQMITSALTVGFGGSTGLEAPIVISGGGIGSAVSRFLGLSYRETTMLLACGAAAGIAAAFNSPIAGIVFAIEILLPEFSIPAFIPLLLASATGAVVARLFYNEQLFYLVTEGWKLEALFFYIVLAILIGGFSLFFTMANNSIKSFFYKIHSPYQKVVIGGLVLGIMVFLFPTLYGEGYITIKSLLAGNYASVVQNSIFSSFSSVPWIVITFTLVTAFAKSAATLVTLGAGGNGGTFAPSLIIGGLLGFVVAQTVNMLGIAQLNVPNFIVAGMAASLSAIMHAPLTGVFLIAEITGGYILMVPLMITSAIAYLINRGKHKYSIYTKPLAEKDALLSHEDKDATVLHMMKLKYLIEKDFLVLNEQDLISAKMTDILQSKRSVFPVVEQGNFKGLVYLEEVLKKYNNRAIEEVFTVSELMVAAPANIRLTDSMKQVLQVMERDNAWLLPVLDENDTYIGFVSKTSIFNKYRALLIRQADYMD